MFLENALLGAFRTEDVGTVSDKSFADQRRVATSALETIVVPMAVFERDESSAANTLNFKKEKFPFFKKKKSSINNNDQPVIGLVQAVQRLANSSPKHSAQ